MTYKRILHTHPSHTDTLDWQDGCIVWLVPIVRSTYECVYSEAGTTVFVPGVMASRTGRWQAEIMLAISRAPISGVVKPIVFNSAGNLFHISSLHNKIICDIRHWTGDISHLSTHSKASRMY
jgi:hypothetical protein